MTGLWVYEDTLTNPALLVGYTVPYSQCFPGHSYKVYLMGLWVYDDTLTNPALSVGYHCSCQCFPRHRYNTCTKYIWWACEYKKTYWLTQYHQRGISFPKGPVSPDIFELWTLNWKVLLLWIAKQKSLARMCYFLLISFLKTCSVLYFLARFPCNW